MENSINYIAAQKKCPRCQEVKDVSQFYKCNTYGVKSYCIPCELQYKKEKRKNSDHNLKIRERRKNDPEFRERMRAHSTASRKKTYCPEKARKYRIAYIEKNKERVTSYRKKYESKKKNDPVYKIARACKSRLHDILKYKRLKKTRKTAQALGCDWETLKIHLESQFTEGMSWDNFGLNGWHIDHIIPLSSAKTEEDVYKLSHYTNLQPLWAIDNIRKKDKILEVA